MDTKEIKSALKIAKDSLDVKDYKTAIKQCKVVLKADRNHYLALVLYGAAVQETEQKCEAVKAFKKAIEVSPEHILAWRGLACYYEKNTDEDNMEDLVKVYEKLLLLETEPNKFHEVISKLQKICDSHFQAVNIKFMQQLILEVDDDKKKLIYQYLVHVLEVNLAEEYNTLYEESLKNLLSVPENTENYLKALYKYLKHLNRQKNVETVIEVATAALNSFPDDTSLLEWTCKAYTELSEEEFKKTVLSYPPEKIYSRLLEIMPNSYLGYFCKGLHELHTFDLVKAVDSLKSAAKLKPKSGLMWLKLSMCQILLYQFSDAEESCVKSLEYLENIAENDNLIMNCKTNLLQCLCESEDEGKCMEATELASILLKLNPSNFKILEYLIKALIKLKRFTDAENYIKNMDKSGELESTKYLKSLILNEKNETDQCRKLLEETTLQSPDYFEAWLSLGKIYYHQNNPNCFTCFLKSAKLNQWCFWNFLYLGHCYSTMVKDLDKARRCYQKAHQLNPSHQEVGMCLSDIYRTLQKEDLNLQLLSSVTSLNPRSKWAWLKLGLHYLSFKKYHDAVNSLQTAVRFNPNDSVVWECLGDAYFSLGAPTSSIKSYQRALELKPDSIYSMLQIAKMKQSIGLLNDSLEDFRIINEKFHNFVPGLKGHAETCLLLMRQHLSQNMNGLARDFCQEAVVYLTKCLQVRKDLICIWKLLGDGCSLLSSLPKKYCILEVTSWLYKGPKGSDENMTLDKHQILKLASRSFCQAIVNKPNLYGLWYDLAFVYNSMVQIGETDEIRKEMRMLACAAVKKSILLNEDRWQSWNLYGIILASKEIQNYSMAQHCFIKAITKLDTNAITWSNLGALYLTVNDLPISNQAFTEAQKFDHNYALCWVGQAIIAHRTGHHDAMDLFRHSTQLGFTSEGCLGYSHWVCHTLLSTNNKSDKNYIYSIKNMNAISVATDLLTWYTDRYTENAWAFNMLGLLLERKMLYKSSEKAFCRALEIIRSKESSRSDVMDQVFLNHSRVLSRLGRFDEALSCLKEIKNATFTNQCQLAVTYYRAKLHDDAYSSYETTLECLAPDAEMKSHILVAMAAVIYLFQGQEDTKLLLMQSCQLKPASVHGLFACCALGMLHSNLALSELALKELQVYRNDPRYMSDIAVFQSYVYLFSGNKQKAVRALCDAIHRHPSQPSLWLSLSLLLLHLHTTFSSQGAAKCAEAALIMGRSSIDVSKVMSLVSLGNLLSGDNSNSIRSSQKAVHMFPDVTENWAVLVASVFSNYLRSGSSKELLWLKNMFLYISKKFDSSKAMTQWLNANSKKIPMADKIMVFPKSKSKPVILALKSTPSKNKKKLPKILGYLFILHFIVTVTILTYFLPVFAYYRILRQY